MPPSMCHAMAMDEDERPAMATDDDEHPAMATDDDEHLDDRRRR